MTSQYDAHGVVFDNLLPCVVLCIIWVYVAHNNALLGVCKMSMYRNYLLKREFWAQPRNDGEKPTCYVKHDVRTGGIYAFLKYRGVRIRVNNEERFFNNFDDLDQFLDRLHMNSREDTSEFMQILNRRTTSKTLRKIPL